MAHSDKMLNGTGNLRDAQVMLSDILLRLRLGDSG